MDCRECYLGEKPDKEPRGEKNEKEASKTNRITTLNLPSKYCFFFACHKPQTFGGRHRVQQFKEAAFCLQTSGFISYQR